MTSGVTPWARMTTAAPLSTSSSVSTVSDALRLELGDHALVVDDLAEGVGRLALCGGEPRVVDRLAHPVAEARPPRDADLFDGSHDRQVWPTSDG